MKQTHHIKRPEASHSTLCGKGQPTHLSYDNSAMLDPFLCKNCERLAYKYPISKNLNGSYFHYKYVRQVEIEVFSGPRRKTHIITLNDGAYEPKPYLEHSMVMPVLHIRNYFKNAKHRVVHNWTRGGRGTGIDHRLRNHGHYIELISSLRLTDFRYQWTLELELTADEYYKDMQTTSHVSDFLEIEGNRFSIIIPEDPGTSTATLTLVHNSTVNSYDPYTFTEDSVLKKENTLPRSDQPGFVEVLFKLK